jgi:hypothetical protein
MDGLETIVVDLLQTRLKAGDAIIIDNPNFERRLVAKVEVGRFAMQNKPGVHRKGGMVPVHAVKISYCEPGGTKFYVVPMRMVPTEIDLVQTGRCAFDIILSSSARKGHCR